MTAEQDFAAEVHRHLASYKNKVLGINEDGIWGKARRPYRHILPRHLRELNIVEPIRERFWREHKARRWPLHRYFHHLSSSQALAFNLFFPIFPDFPSSFKATAALLGLSQASRWRVDFEVVTDRLEGTSFDVLFASDAGARLIVEVKYTEAAFGRARNDSEHIRKLDRFYRPLLANRIDPSCLEPKEFFGAYQLYRNLAHLRANSDDRLLLLLPRAREQLWDWTVGWCARPELGSLRDWVGVVALEDVIVALGQDDADAVAGPGFVRELTEKYLTPGP